MKSLSQFIAEAFDTAPAKWKKVSNGLYYFQIDDAIYDVEFLNADNTIGVTFSIDLGPETHKIYNLTGTGNQFKVLSTVMDIIRAYINENKELFNKEEKGMIFFSSKGKSRTGVYTRMIKRFLPKDWNVVQDDSSRTETVFLLGPKEYV